MARLGRDSRFAVHCDPSCCPSSTVAARPSVPRYVSEIPLLASLSLDRSRPLDDLWMTSLPLSLPAGPFTSLPAGPFTSLSVSLPMPYTSFCRRIRADLGSSFLKDGFLAT